MINKKTEGISKVVRLFTEGQRISRLQDVSQKVCDFFDQNDVTPFFLAGSCRQQKSFRIVW